MNTILNPWREAAETIRTRGWVRGSLQASDGRVCLTGALKVCSPVPGDWLIARAVARHRGHGETWNDDGMRTKDNVVAWLDTADPITDVELAEVFGPQWEPLVAWIRRAAILTDAEAAALVAARDAARDAARSAAWDAALDAARIAARSAAWGAARDAARVAVLVAARDAAWDAALDAALDAARIAARDAAWDAARDAALDAAWDAALDAARIAARSAAWGAAMALSVRDLIGQHGFKQHHYDTLTKPWRKVIGPVHPDDEGANQ